MGLATFAVMGCASQSQHLSNCSTQTWASAGRSDGLAGKGLDAVETWTTQCETPPTPEELSAYNENRLEGLQIYCSPKSAFAVGASGRPYLFVCSETLEPAFLKAFHLGRAQFRIEEKTRDLTLQIQAFSTRLASPLTENSQRTFLKKEIESLKASLEATQKEREILNLKRRL